MAANQSSQLAQPSHGPIAPATTIATHTMENLVNVNVGANQRWNSTNYIVQHISLHKYLLTKPQLRKIIEDDNNTMLSVFRKQRKQPCVLLCFAFFRLFF